MVSKRKGMAKTKNIKCHKQNKLAVKKPFSKTIKKGIAARFFQAAISL